MAYTFQQQPENLSSPISTPVLSDAALLRAARQIYQVYAEVHRDRLQRPLGVAIHRFTYRGKLIFTRKPVLLPQESFVPFSQLESEIY